MVKFISIIIISIFVLIDSACNSMKINSAMKPKRIFDQKLSDSERIKLSYLHYRDCKTFYILIYQKNNWLIVLKSKIVQIDLVLIRETPLIKM
jgi:hypothetical protein